MALTTLSTGRRASPAWLAWPTLALAAMLLAAAQFGASPAFSCTAPGGGEPSCGGGGAASVGGGGFASVMVGGGNPINLLSGNKYQEETDLPALPGVLGLELKRHYNSESGYPGLAGAQWRISYETVLYDLGNQVQIVQADGRRITLQRGAGAKAQLCTSPQLQDGQVRIEENGKQRAYHWRWADGRTLTFRSVGPGTSSGNPLHSIQAATGERVQLAYNPLGDLIRVTDPQGRQINFIYGKAASGRRALLQSVTTPLGRIAYRHDDQGRLTEVAYGAPSHRSRLYHYENAYNAGNTFALTGISDQAPGANGQATERRVSTYAYDARGRAILSTKGLPLQPGKDGTGIGQITLQFVQAPSPQEGSAGRDGEVQPRPEGLGRVLLTNSLGQTSTLLTAIIGGQLRLIAFTGAGCSSCGPANRRYAYDGAGRLLRTVELDAQGQPLSAELQRYDGQGRLLQVSQQHYAQGKLAGEPRLLRRYEYTDTRGADGGVVPGLRPTLVAMPSVVAGRERSTRLSYNERGQVLSLAEAGWSPINAGGESIATPITRVTIYRYVQRRGHSVLVEADGPLPNGPKAAPGDSDITQFEWDEPGLRLLRVRHPLGWTEAWSHDDAGRVATYDTTDAAVTRFSYDADGRVLQRTTGSVTDRIERRAGVDTLRRNGELIWQAARDPLQHLTHLLDASGGQLVFGHDSEGRRVARASFDADSARALRSVDVAVPAGSDSGGVATDAAAMLEAFAATQSRSGAQGVHVRRFDDFGRVVSLSNPVTGTAFARYDEADHLVYSQDGHGRSQQLQYDALGRLRAHWHARDGRRELVREFDYRGTLLVAARSADVTETRQYDAAGHLVERARTVGGHRYVERFDYDAAGRMVLQTLPDGSRVGLEWAADRIRAVRVNGQLVVGDVAYAPASQTPVAYTLGGRQVAWRWDDARGMRSVSWDGQQWRQGELAPSADTPVVPPGLLAALLPSAHAATPQEPPHALAAAIASLPDAAVEDGIDLERGPDGLPASWHGWQLQFDPSSRLVAASEGGRQRRYAYDAWGAQSLVRDGSGSSQRLALYSGYRRTLEADAQGAITVQYVYLPAPGAWRPVARITARGVEALMTDTRGAIVEARTLGGDVTYAARYDDNGALVQESPTPPGWLAQAWGRLRYVLNRGWQKAAGFPAADVADPAAAISLRLPGQAADPDTGLHYNFNRHYDPGAGRYLEPDPAGLAGGNDLYAYADGQPLLGIDPWGLAKIRYFAVDDGVLVASDGMPNKGHWAFAVYDIVDNMDKVLIFDKGGSFLSGGKSAELFKGTTVAAKVGDLGAHYGLKDGYYSPTEFEIRISDDTAKAIIKNLTDEDLGLGMCPAPIAALLPDIDLGLQGKLNPMAKHAGTTEDNRIVPCKAGATAEEVRFERIKKAIEVHESGDADCAKAASAFGGKTTCPAGTWNPSVIPGTTDRAPASYGWVQFIFRTFAGELHVNYSAYKATLDGLGVTKAQLDSAMKRMDDTKKWYDKIGTATWAADGKNFTAETGLDETNFNHMQAWSSLKGKIEGAMADTDTPLFKQSVKGKQAADRVNPDLWRTNLQKATKLSWTEKDVAGKTVVVEETDAQFTARTTLRDEITDLATKSGTTITVKTLNPYIRTSKNWGESTAGFQVAAVLGGDKPLSDAFLKIFTDKPTHDKIADVWIKKLIKRVGTDRLAPAAPTTAEEEKNLAEWVFSKHNGGEGRKTKIPTYLAKTDPIWERTFCLAGTGIKEPGYLRLTALDPK